MLSVVVLSDSVHADELGRWRYEGEGCAVVIEPHEALSTWTMTTAARDDAWALLASRSDGVVSLDVPSDVGEQPAADHSG